MIKQKQLTKGEGSRGQISAGKISIIAVLIVTLVFGIWFFSGWPRIWQKPPVPPEI